MPRWRKAIKTEGSILGDLLIDARDVFSRERYEERLDYQLAILTQRFHKGETVSRKDVQDVVDGFLRDVDITYRMLEDAKKKAEQEESSKIEKIEALLEAGAKVNSREFKKELIKLGKSIESSTVAGLRSQQKRERRLKKGKAPAPLGYFLKKVSSTKRLERDIARRTGEAAEDTAKEHELSIEVRKLIPFLNANLNKHTYAMLEKNVKSLVKNYKNDIQDFLNVEIDIGIVEARKLHQIDHFITFLKMYGDFNDLTKKLNKLKNKVSVWVYQDSIDAKKLVRYAKMLNYGINVLEKSKASTEGDFPNIVVQNAPINDMYGLLFYDKTKPKPSRAVVLVHGVYQSKETFLTLGKRLASLDFWVYSIDFTSHGESREKFHLGRSCEHVQTAVRYFKLNGIKNVGVIGHSLGAVTALFAICGYNVKVENEFYEIEAKISKLLDYLLEEFKNNKFYTINRRNWLMSKELSEYYTELKRLVLNALEVMYKGNSKIDAAVMLSAPITMQFIFPSFASRLLKGMSPKTHRKLGKFVDNFLNKKFIEQEGPNAQLYKNVAKGNEVQMMSAVFADVYYTYNYAETVKNPYDYMNILNYLCEKDKSNIVDTRFFKYYKNIIRKVPKLFIYGLKDQWLRPLGKKYYIFGKDNMPELEQHYEDFSSQEKDEFGKVVGKVVVRYPDVIHALNKEGMDYQFETGKLPKMTYKIVTFLNRYLGSGRVLISQEGNVKKKF